MAKRGAFRGTWSRTNRVLEQARVFKSLSAPLPRRPCFWVKAGASFPKNTGAGEMGQKDDPGADIGKK
jgi:hypothetical protein